MTPEERRRLKVAGATKHPDLMTDDEKRWLGVPSPYPQS